MSLTELQARLTAQAKLIDQAAERGHEAMFDGELAESGIERELWRQVVRAILETPGLMITAEDIERMTKETMERTATALRAQLDQGMLLQVDALEEAANLCPDHVNSPGMIAAARLLRKVIAK